MTALVNVLREIAGLFVDDGALALAIIGVIAAAAAVAALMPGTLAPGAILMIGCVGVLLGNVVRAARR